MTNDETTEELEYVEDEEYGSSPEVKNQTKRLRATLKKLKEEKQEYLEGWQRAKADVINARKDAEVRVQAARKWGEEELVQEILLVLDNFDLALMNGPEGDAWTEGIRRIAVQLQAVLTTKGFQLVKVSVGDAFNPADHEAIEQRESDKKEGTILEVRRNGYRSGDRLLRPAQVVVSS